MQQPFSQLLNKHDFFESLNRRNNTDLYNRETFSIKHKNCIQIACITKRLHHVMPTHTQHRALCKTLGNAPVNIFIGCHGLFFAKSNVAGSLLAKHKGQTLNASAWALMRANSKPYSFPADRVIDLQKLDMTMYIKRNRLFDRKEGVYWSYVNGIRN